MPTFWGTGPLLIYQVEGRNFTGLIILTMSSLSQLTKASATDGDLSFEVG